MGRFQQIINVSRESTRGILAAMDLWLWLKKVSSLSLHVNRCSLSKIFIPSPVIFNKGTSSTHICAWDVITCSPHPHKKVHWPGSVLVTELCHQRTMTNSTDDHIPVKNLISDSFHQLSWGFFIILLGQRLNIFSKDLSLSLSYVYFISV